MKLQGKHTPEVAKRIVDAFRNPEQLPNALAPIFIHRDDDVPCRKWSWSNQLLVALNGTRDARGIRQWNEVGRKVKKGCKALWIFVPCVKTRTVTNDDGEDEVRRFVYGFKSMPVFAVEDTEGELLPEADTRYNEWIQQLPLIEVAKAWNINVDTFSHNGGDPLGYFRYANNGDKAVLLGVENLATWSHELVHAADHRLTNLKGEKWHKEIVAELGGAILLECLGMSHDADLGGAFSYIEQYARDAKVDTVRACIQVLDRVCNCVKLILDTAESTATAAEPSELSATA